MPEKRAHTFLILIFKNAVGYQLTAPPPKVCNSTSNKINNDDFTSILSFLNIFLTSIFYTKTNKF